MWSVSVNDPCGFFSFLEFLFILLFIYLFCHAGFSVLHRLFSGWQAGATLSCDVLAPHCGDFSFCGLWPRELGPQQLGSGLRSTDSTAGAHSLVALDTWDPPGSGVEPVSPALAGDSLIPEPPWTSLVAQLVKNLPALQETWVWSLGWEDPPEKGMATLFSILAWRFHGQRSLVAYSALGRKESGTTQQLRLSPRKPKSPKPCCLWKPLSKLQTMCIPGRVEVENFLCYLVIKALSFSLALWD